MTVLRNGKSETISLPAGQTLTVTPVGTARVVWQGGYQDITGETTYGPFATTQFYRLQAKDGDLTYSVDVVDFATLEEATATFGGESDLRELVGDGAPDESAAATLDVNPDGDDNGLTFTAVEFGEGGNEISVAYVDPGTAESPLSVSVIGKAITVSLETDDSEPPEIVTTAAEVLAAIEASPAASALVTVAIDTGDTGAEDDGSGVVTAMEAALLEDGAGAGVGTAGKGSRYTDIENGTLYLNTGTKAEPVWAALAFD